MTQQILDTVPERRRRRRAARARPFHVEIDDAILEAPEGDVAAVIGHAGRTRVSISSLMVATVSASPASKNSSASLCSALPPPAAARRT